MCSRAVKGTRFPAPMGTESNSRALLFPGQTSIGLADSARPDKWTDLLEPLSDSAPQSAMIGRCQKICPMVSIV